jgi:hypothetical protein
MATSSRSTLATLAMGITDQRHWRIIQLFALAGPLIGSATWAISELPGAQASGEILDSLKSLPLLVLTSLPAAYMMGFVPALCTGILAAIIWAHMGVSPWLRKAGHRRLGPCRFFLRDLPIQQSRAIRYRVRMFSRTAGVAPGSFQHAFVMPRCILEPLPGFVVRGAERVASSKG